MNTDNATTDNVLTHADQALFSLQRATGIASVVQCMWTYNRHIDLDCLRTFHRNLQRGRLARRIQLSPLPFGRHRWVTPAEGPALHISAPLPRTQTEHWLTEQAQMPIDPEQGPGWRLAVLPLIDGGAVVSLVVSHCIADGIGLGLAIAEAVMGWDSGIRWPAAGTRRRMRVLRDDAVQTIRDIPSAARAARAAARMRQNQARPTASRAGGFGSGERITLPTAIAYLDAAEFDARAAALGGTPNALMAAVAAEVGRRLGRSHDGTVAVSIPVNERVAGDTRANAVGNIEVPIAAGTDLPTIRAHIKEALSMRGEAPDPRAALLPLIPFLPRRVFRAMLPALCGGPGNVVSSNIGEVLPVLNRPDGNDADDVIVRTLYTGVTTAAMHLAGGVLALISGRLDGRLAISVLSYQPGRENTNAAVDRVVDESLAAFALRRSAVMEVSS